MVRLFNLDKNNIGKVKDFAYKVMHLQELVTHVAEYNHPENIRPCVYAMWHENQCACYGLSDKGKVNILISNSKDGQVIAHVMHKFGFQTCRGSSNRRGAVSGTCKPSSYEPSNIWSNVSLGSGNFALVSALKLLFDS